MDTQETDTTAGDVAGQDFDEGALMAAAAAAVEGDDVEQGEEGEAAAEGEAQQAAAGESQIPGLEELRKIAAERAKAQQTQATTTEAPAVPDFAKLTEAMTGAAAYKQAIEAAASGDFSKIAKLAGKDEATLYETWTQRAIKGDAHSMEQKIAALEAKLAEFEAKKLPDDVLTEAKLKEMELSRVYEQNRKRFTDMTSDSQKFPGLSFLAKIDPQIALRYGGEAEELVRGTPHMSLETVAQLAEQIALERHGDILKAQQSDGRAQQSNGVVSEAAATSATSGSNRAGVTIDNRAAAETASSLPDFTDEAAFVARARKVAESM